MLPILLVAYFLCVLTPYAQSTLYEQSQMGKLNVQVDLKDLHIIALMKGGKEEYVDYDYAYDYSEMTIKPQNGTTPKPLNVTNITISNTTSLEKDNTTSIMATTTVETTASAIKNSTILDTETSTESTFITTATSSSTEFTTRGNETEVQDTILNHVNMNSTSNNGGCKKGFVLNKKGDCELKLQSGGGNALLKLVKLSQQLKLRREKQRPTALIRPDRIQDQEKHSLSQSRMINLGN